MKNKKIKKILKKIIMEFPVIKFFVWIDKCFIRRKKTKLSQPKPLLNSKKCSGEPLIKRFYRGEPKK